ncbi:MAG TPA: hypothetical protein VOA41_05315 [Candidatus Dormibacteraeota bacterium]|nr:hypothetical protein [Candidatus Dormibacteraeota bacterium]
MNLPNTVSSKHRSASFLVSPGVALLLVLIFFEGASHGAPQKNKKNQSALVSSMAADKGKLKILLEGQLVGSEEFEISPLAGIWVARGATDIQAPGAKPTRVVSTFRLQSDGTPQKYEWSAQGEKKASGSVTFQGGVATVQLDLGGTKPFDEEHTFSSPLIAVLDNNLYHHYAILARLYDWNKKGKQAFPVLIPQDITPGTIEVDAKGKETVDGASYETLKLTTPDLEVTLYLDSSHRLMRLTVPVSKVAVIRE